MPEDEAIFCVDDKVSVPFACLVVVGPSVAIPSVIGFATVDWGADDDDDILKEGATELVVTFFDDVDDSSAWKRNKKNKCRESCLVT